MHGLYINYVVPAVLELQHAVLCPYYRSYYQVLVDVQFAMLVTAADVLLCVHSCCNRRVVLPYTQTGATD